MHPEKPGSAVPVIHLLAIEVEVSPVNLWSIYSFYMLLLL